MMPRFLVLIEAPEPGPPVTEARVRAALALRFNMPITVTVYNDPPKAREYSVPQTEPEFPPGGAPLG